MNSSTIASTDALDASVLTSGWRRSHEYTIDIVRGFAIVLMALDQCRRSDWWLAYL